MKKIILVGSLILVFLAGCVLFNIPPDIVYIQAPESVVENTNFEVEISIEDENNDNLDITIEFNGFSKTLEGKSGIYRVSFRAPDVNSEEDFTILVRVKDEFNAVDEKSVTVSVVPNRPPVVESFSFPGRVWEGDTFTVTAVISDPNGLEDVTSVSIEFNGVVRNPIPDTSGEVRATFTAPEVNRDSYLPVSIEVSDRNSEKARITRNIEILNKNRPPVWEDIPDQYVMEGSTLVLDLRNYVFDPDGDDISITLVSGPGSVTEGVYSWSTTYEDSGTYNVEVRATDSNGSSTDAQFEVVVQDVNRPPSMPSDPYPENGAFNVPTSVVLSWNCSDPDGDTLTYDLYFGTSSNPTLVATDIATNSHNPGTLQYDTTYYWKVVAKDGRGGISEGPLWSFTTAPERNYSIYMDSKNARAGRVAYLNVSVEDPDGNPAENEIVKLQYYDTSSGTWKDLVDVLSGTSTAITDSSGTARFSVLSYEATTLDLRALLVEHPEILASAELVFESPNWVFLVYLAADNNLEVYAFYDMNEMRQSNPNVSVMVLFDSDETNATTHDSFRVLDENGDWVILEIYSSDINSGSQNVLKIYAERLLRTSAAHHALVIWDHGSAWLNDSDYDSDYGSRMGIEAIAFDDNTGDALSTVEIKNAISYAESTTGEFLDVIGMDACLMGSIEVAYELRNVARYMIASASLEPGSGWNYDFMANIDSSTDAVDLARNVVDRYFAANPYASFVLTMAVYDLSRMGNLASSVSNFGETLRDSLSATPTLRSNLLNYKSSSIHYGQEASSSLDYLIDLGDFAYGVHNNETDAALVNSALSVLNSLDSAIVYKGIYGGNSSSVAMSIFLTEDFSILNYYQSDLDSLDFYTDPTISGWREFLNVFAQ